MRLNNERTKIIHTTNKFIEKEQEEQRIYSLIAHYEIRNEFIPTLESISISKPESDDPSDHIHFQTLLEFTLERYIWDSKAKCNNQKMHSRNN